MSADIIANPIVVPHRSGQQVLHPLGIGVAGLLGRPGLLASPAHPDRTGHDLRLEY
jgi:hypothetical protein